MKNARLWGFGRDEDGVAAIEFALIAPIFIFALMSMADIGLAAYDRMKLTNGVRNAAQYVMTVGDDQNVITDIVTTSSGLGSKVQSVTVNEYCACSGGEGTGVACTTICADGNMTNVYMQISAQMSSKQLLKTWDIQSSVEVRKR